MDGEQLMTSDELPRLILLCAGGDAASWERFVGVFNAIGHATLRRLRLDTATIDDVLSGVLTSLYEGRLKQFRGHTTGEAVNFLRVMIRNAAFTALRRPSHYGFDQGSGSAGVPDPARSFSDELADRDCLELLRRKIASMGRNDAELYLMKEKGLKEREIAVQTGRPPGTISAQIARLLEKVRVHLREHGCL